MKLGVCYYPEHWPPERWPIDARLMREAGLSLVRVAEFACTYTLLLNFTDAPLTATVRGQPYLVVARNVKVIQG